MLYRDKEITELWDLKHRNDNFSHKGFDYNEKLLTKSLSNFMFHNENMSEFITIIKNSLVLYFDSFNIVRNFKNYLVDKYYDQHIN